jgi:hypothetical protein
MKNYITENWDLLPKSQFNNFEVVIFKCDEEYDGGYGHHSYSGWGVGIDGNVYYCYSSGCSCSGSASCEIDTTKDIKVLLAGRNVEDEYLEKVDYKSLQVSYSDY